jgi:hypothetical protein
MPSSLHAYSSIFECVGYCNLDEHYCIFRQCGVINLTLGLDQIVKTKKATCATIAKSPFFPSTHVTADRGGRSTMAAGNFLGWFSPFMVSFPPLIVFPLSPQRKYTFCLMLLFLQHTLWIWLRDVLPIRWPDRSGGTSPSHVHGSYQARDDSFCPSMHFLWLLKKILYRLD